MCSASGRVLISRGFGSVHRIGNHPLHSGGNVPAAIIDAGYVGQADDPDQLAIAINHRQLAHPARAISEAASPTDVLS
jgi:hypothetical protein